MIVGEHLIPFDDSRQQIKLLAEYHHLADATLEDTTTAYNYPSASGWVAGIEHTINVRTAIPGSFNQAALRYGHGIANGGDGGNSRTWLTYGAPDRQTHKFSNAYSIALVDHILVNVNSKYSVNAYGLYTKSRGAADSVNKAPDYFDRQLFNRKTEYAFGARNLWYIKKWFHLITELHYANRIDGNQSAASMVKFSLVPTIVPSAKAHPSARPHFRVIYSIARYNSFASENLYSPYLAEIGPKKWGTYIGIRAEWWLY
jgi:maltoporin